MNSLITFQKISPVGGKFHLIGVWLWLGALLLADEPSPSASSSTSALETSLFFIQEVSSVYTCTRLIQLRKQSWTKYSSIVLTFFTKPLTCDNNDLTVILGTPSHAVKLC